MDMVYGNTTSDLDERDTLEVKPTDNREYSNNPTEQVFISSFQIRQCAASHSSQTQTQGSLLLPLV